MLSDGQRTLSGRSPGLMTSGPDLDELRRVMSSQRLGVPVGDFIRLSAARTPNAPCFVDGCGRMYSFQRVNEGVNRLASALRERGVQRGDRIAILAVDSVAYLETILAAMKLGATYIALNYRLQQQELANLLRVTDPVALMIGGRYGALLPGIRSASPRLSTVVALEGEIDGAIGFDELLETGGPDDLEVLATDDDILSIAFTSGTTGSPKGVMQSHRMFKAMLVQRLYYFRVGEQEFRYSAAPSFHIGGIGMILLGVFAGYGHLVLPQFDAPTVQHHMSHSGLTGCFLVPTMISSILELPQTHESTYPDLRLLIYGSSPMSPALLRRAMGAFDCDFLNAFGAGTEAGMQTVLTPEDHRRAGSGSPRLLDSIGRPVRNLELRLLDQDTQEVADGEVGEIVTRGETIMSGYLDQPERTAETLLPGGWIRCGDLASADEEGYLYLAGRRDDMIIRGGENVYPVEIESVLADVPGVAEAVAIGVPDEHWGEVVHAYLLLSGSTFDAEAAREITRSRLAAYKVPEAFVVVDEFPRNASGKVLRRELRRQAAEFRPERQSIDR
jgi:acyl-CoA synthetase (AMP-forming)/AMP-acid ligase II